VVCESGAGGVGRAQTRDRTGPEQIDRSPENQPRTARGFEQPDLKHTLSPGLCAAMDDLVAEHTRQTQALAGSSDLIRLPRTNSTPPGTGNSAGWHLTIAARPTHTRPHHIS